MPASPEEQRNELRSANLPPAEAAAPVHESAAPPLPRGSSRSSSVPGCSIIHMARTVMFWASASPRAPEENEQLLEKMSND